MCTFHRYEANLEREVTHVTQHVTVRWDVNLKPILFLWQQQAASLGRALYQAHVFQFCLCHIFLLEFPTSVHFPPKNASFPSGRFHIKRSGLTLQILSCAGGCNISCTGEWSQVFVHGPGMTAWQKRWTLCTM